MIKQKPDKRIVSKGEYAKAKGKQMGLRLTAGLFYLVTLFFALKAGSCAIFLLRLIYHVRINEALFLIYIIMFLLMGTMAYFFRKWGNASMHKARVLDNVIPITRANTSNLPASDSLVRASSEPLQVQQAVLLRAAVETTQEQEAELLRPSAGSEERR